MGPGKFPKRFVIKRFNEDPAPLCSLGILLTTYPATIGSKALAKKKKKPPNFYLYMVVHQSLDHSPVVCLEDYAFHS